MDRSWIKQIDFKQIELYPIQFANCDRLAQNDAVYIFDEVGSGKTISSGLMAIDYLFNNKGKNILIITTNSLSRKDLLSINKQGQFLQDWFDKLPFLELGFDARIEIVNNYYSHFLSNKEYGLVIIDEAHLFLNENSERCKELTNNIKAEKVIFLTATPIKNDGYDLYTYWRIAQEITKITGKEIPNNWIEEINTQYKSENNLICSSFDSSSPVTRYFKDTIMALNSEKFEKIKAKRLLSEVWEYDIKKSEIKLEVLLKNIKEVLKNDEKSKFVIFTRYVEKEAKKIEEYLCKDEDFLCENDTLNISSNKKWTVKVVTGENASELAKFKGHDNLPTVLVLTYQVAEQGTNLPGFNYVINFHIPPFPSSLEQRFGRIDRMGKNGSQFDEIHMCFLIRENTWDTDTCNFYIAVSKYMHNLISYLPSKNAILSEKIINSYNQAKNLVDQYIQKIESLLSNPKLMNKIERHFQNLEENQEEIIQCEDDKILFEFIEEYGLYDRCEKIFKKNVKEKLSELKKEFKEPKGQSLTDIKKIIEKVGDKIFYFTGNLFDENTQELHTLDAIEDCAQYIKESDNFKEYEEKFQKQIELPRLLKKYPNYIKYLNKYFENEFVKNKIENIFPIQGYNSILNKAFENENIEQISKENREKIIQNADYIIWTLPFFKMCLSFKNILKSYVYSKGKSIRCRFDFNPFSRAFIALGNKIFHDIDSLGLSKDYIENNWIQCENGSISHKTIKNIDNLFVITQDNETGIISASNWYKLAYHFLRKEEACFILNENGFILREQDEELNYFYNLEKYLKEISKDKNKYFDFKNNKPKQWQSLFNHYIYTDRRGFKRQWIAPQNTYLNPEVSSTDIWTQGIYFELFSININNRKWSDILPLPKEYKDIPLFDKNGKLY